MEWVAETGSTNADVLTRARAGEPEGLVLVADHQTAGRGRLDRRWESRPGDSLLCSLLVRRPPAGLPPTIAMAVAAADAVAAVTAGAVRPGLKWPNDLLVGERKLAGILAQADGDAVVIGIGLNVSWAGPPDAALGGTALADWVDPPPDRRALLLALLGAFERRLGSPDLLDAYRSRCVTLGRRVRVDLGDRTIEGVAEDVGADGHLVVDGRAVHAGDVVHLR